MKKALLQINNAVTTIEEKIVGYGVIIAALIIFVNVILRATVDYAFTWAEELTRYIFIWVTFLGGNLAIQRDIHVKMDVLQTKLPFRAAKILVVISLFICVIGCAFVTKTGYLITKQSFDTGAVTSTMSWLKKWMINVCVPVFGIIGIKDYLWLLILNLTHRDEIIKVLVKEERS